MQSDEAMRNYLSNASTTDLSSCRVDQAGKLLRPILSALLQAGRWLCSWLADLFCCLFRYTSIFDVEHNRGGYQFMFGDYLMGDHPWRAPFVEERALRVVCEPQEHSRTLESQTWDDQRFDHVDSPCPPEPTQAWKGWFSYDKFLDFPRILFEFALHYVTLQFGVEVVLLLHWMYIVSQQALIQLRPKDLSLGRIEDRDLGVAVGRDVPLIE